MLDGCKFRQLSVQLAGEYYYSHAALTLKDGDKAIVCFDLVTKMRCEQFDGSRVTWVMSMTNKPRSHSGLGLYYGRPATVGGGKDAQGSTETLRKIWIPVASHPRFERLYYIILISKFKMDWEFCSRRIKFRKLADDWRV